MPFEVIEPVDEDLELDLYGEKEDEEEHKNDKCCQRFKHRYKQPHVQFLVGSVRSLVMFFVCHF